MSPIEHSHGDFDTLPLADRMRLLSEQADEDHIRAWATEVEALSATTRGAVSERDRLRREIADVLVYYGLAEGHPAYKRLYEALNEPGEGAVNTMTLIGPGPDMNPERLPTGTLLEDLGCPHCGKTCDVCVTLDEIAADDRKLLKGAVDLLRRALPYVREARHESGVRSASALADEIAALLPEGGEHG